MWKSLSPIDVELGQPKARELLVSFTCNDKHIFCGHWSGIVGVYHLNDGIWVRDLVPSERISGNNQVAGGKHVLAAVSSNRVLTVWSTTREMEELHCFNAHNFRCLDDSCVLGADSNIVNFQEMDQSKIAVLVVHRDCNKGSLVFLKKGEHVWEEKIVACSPLPILQPSPAM